MEENPKVFLDSNSYYITIDRLGGVLMSPKCEKSCSSIDFEKVRILTETSWEFGYFDPENEKEVICKPTKELMDNYVWHIYKNPEKLKVEIELTEFDIETLREVVYENKSVKWDYKTNDGQEIEVEFISEEEKEQREK